MAEFNYERWWSLHLRAVKGDPLSEQEQIDYNLGLDLLNEESEMVDSATLDRLRTLRSAIDRATTLHGELSARSAALDNMIDRLEATFQRLTGHSLSPQAHVPA